MALTYHYRFGLLALVCACGDPKDPGAATAASSGDASTGTATTDAPGDASTGTDTTAASGDTPTTTGAPMEWPLCEPWQIDRFDFVIGGDPEDAWPDGHHVGSCRFASLTATEKTEQSKTLWTSVVALQGCVDEQGSPAAHSLDLVILSTAPLAVPLVPEQALEVDHVTATLSSVEYQRWYSLRDASSGELLLAAFADPGPTLAPKLPGEPPLADWLDPFAAELGEFACPVEVGPFCEVAPQRAILKIVRDAQEIGVVGGDLGDLGDYLVHLGFAGAPEACDGAFTQRPLHGVLVKKP